MDICYNHIIYAEFEIINMFFQERRSKYKPPYALDTQHFLNCSCLYRDSSLVMEIWFKVLEIHRSTCVRTLNGLHTHTHTHTLSSFVVVVSSCRKATMTSSPSSPPASSSLNSRWERRRSARPPCCRKVRRPRRGRPEERRPWRLCLGGS